MPFDPGAKLNLTLKTNKWVFNKAYSRSYYLLINDNNQYQAYILTIIADSDYVKNDLTKLTHNSYRKLDADFSGLVLYYTPKGDYIGGYGYKDGHLVQPETTATQSDSKKIQNVNMGALKPNTMVADCVDWYQQTTVYYEDGHSETFDWVYLDTTCTYRDDGTNTGSTPPAAPPALPPPPPPCPPGTGTGSSPCNPVNVDEVKNNNVPLPPNPGDGGTAPPPAQTQCAVSAPAVPCTVAFDANITNHLTHDCLKSILSAIKGVKSGNIASIISELSGNAPGYNWTISEGALPATEYGETSYSKTTGTATTVFDFNKLKQGTDISVITTMIHETVHSYLAAYFINDPINFNKTYAGQLDAYYKAQNLNDAQHILMAKAFVLDIAAAIKATALALGDKNIDDLEFSDMAWAGLQGTTAYLSLSNEDQTRIQNRISAEHTKIASGDAYPDGKGLTCN